MITFAVPTFTNILENRVWRHFECAQCTRATCTEEYRDCWWALLHFPGAQDVKFWDRASDSHSSVWVFSEIEMPVDEFCVLGCNGTATDTGRWRDGRWCPSIDGETIQEIFPVDGVLINCHWASTETSRESIGCSQLLVPGKHWYKLLENCETRGTEQFWVPRFQHAWWLKV